MSECVCCERRKEDGDCVIARYLEALHSLKNFAVSVRYRWTSLDKAERFGPDFHIELSSANSASLTPFDDSGKLVIMIRNSSGLSILPCGVPFSRKCALEYGCSDVDLD